MGTVAMKKYISTWKNKGILLSSSSVNDKTDEYTCTVSGANMQNNSNAT